MFALQDEPEVPRVWLPFDDAPGLAMARAFGDFCLKDYGVISVPEFFHWTLTDKDQFIILASDGVILSLSLSLKFFCCSSFHMTKCYLGFTFRCLLVMMLYPILHLVLMDIFLV